jgi:hypothetical protein
LTSDIPDAPTLHANVPVKAKGNWTFDIFQWQTSFPAEARAASARFGSLASRYFGTTLGSNAKKAQTAHTRANGAFLSR